MKRRILSLVLLVTTYLAVAQETYSPDRPGMATGTGLMAPGSIDWESGMECDWTSDSHSWLLPTTMVRLGLTKYAELRLEYDGSLDKDGDHWRYNVQPLVIGTKLRACDGHGWVPDISIMANLSIPCTKALTDEMHVAPQIYALFNNDINEHFSIGYNVGAEWNGVSTKPIAFVAVCLGAGITDHLGAFLESYNYFGHGDAQCCADFGLNYMLTDRLQLDVNAGLPFCHPRDGAFVGIGVAWQIK